MHRLFFPSALGCTWSCYTHPHARREMPAVPTFIAVSAFTPRCLPRYSTPMLVRTPQPTHLARHCIPPCLSNCLPSNNLCPSAVFGAPQVFAPLLHPSALHTELSAALLLHGPHGSGRRTAARAAAAALGLHCVAVSCHELAAPPGQDAAKGGAAAALRAVVAAAERFAPALLLLQVGVPRGWIK